MTGCLASPGQSTTADWITPGPTPGNWTNTINWNATTASGLPESDTAVSINNGGVVEVLLPGQAAYSVGIGSGAVGTLNITAGAHGNVGALTVGSGGLSVGSAGAGTLNVTAGGGLETPLANISFGLGSTGSAYVSGTSSDWTNTGEIIVGNQGSGDLIVNSGGKVATDTMTIGKGDGVFSVGDGEAFVNGAGSTLTVSNSFSVGDRLRGSLWVRNGGQVITANTVLGNGTNGDGMVVVDGAGSSWSNSGTLSVSSGRITLEEGLLEVGAGSGTVQLGNGGFLAFGNHGATSGTLSAATIDGSGTIEFTHESPAAVVVDEAIQGSITVLATGSGTTRYTGNGSYSGDTTISDGRLEITNGGGISTAGDFFVNGGLLLVEGSGGGGTLNADLLENEDGTVAIEGGGQATLNNLVIGKTAGAQTGVLPADVLLGDAGSSLTVNNQIIVGGEGNGRLTIQEGTQVEQLGSSQPLIVGEAATSQAIVMISGAGASLTTASALRVGDRGTAAVNIFDGGSLTNMSAVVGNQSGGDGTVTVSGSGSTWSNTSGLQIGSSGIGLVEIVDDGVLSVAGGSGVVNIGATGALTIGSETGSGSSELPGILQADRVTGVAGGEVRFAHVAPLHLFGQAIQGNVGLRHAKSGLTRLTGTSSYDGATLIEQGTLEVSEGGVLSGTLLTRVGVNSGDDGALKVIGTGTSSMTTSTLIVGEEGRGVLEVKQAGTLSADSISIGEISGGEGLGSVDGAGSQVSATTNFTVGKDTTGTLNLTNGGTASLTSTVNPFTIGAAGNADGTVDADGDGSLVSISSELVVGDSGTGRLRLKNGGDASSLQATLGLSSGGAGTVTVSGDGSEWTTTGGVSVGAAGSGEVAIDTSGQATSGSATIVTGAGDGTATVENANSLWTVNGDLIVGDGGSGSTATAMLSIRDGGRVLSHQGTIGKSGTGTNSATVDGVGSNWTMTGTFNVGTGSNATLTIQNGGLVSNASGRIDSGRAGITSVVQVIGNQSQWSNAQDLVVGNAGAGQLDLQGGLVEFESLTVGAMGSINWSTGELRDISDLTIDGGFLADVGLASSTPPSIGVDKTLAVDGTATLTTLLELNGGTFETGYLIGGTDLDMKGGTFRLTQANLGIQSGGIFGDNLQVNPALNVQVTNDISIASGAQLSISGGTVTGGTITNVGTLSGTGFVNGPFENQSGGLVRTNADPGNPALDFQGGSFTNAGAVEAIGNSSLVAELSVAGAAENSAGGRIAGNWASFEFTNGLDNRGLFEFDGGTSAVAGDVVSTGTLLVSNGSQVAFSGAVVQNGLLQVDSGSTAIFDGALSGSGGGSGGGLIQLGGTIRPGNSPGVMAYENDVQFTGSSYLELELGGLNPGTQHDQITSTMSVTLDGTIELTLINGFVPQLGDSFELVVADSIADNGVGYVLPALSGGRSFEMTLNLAAGSMDVLSATVVPEPTTILLLLVAAGMLAFPRRFPTRQNNQPASRGVSRRIEFDEDDHRVARGS